MKIMNNWLLDIGGIHTAGGVHTALVKAYAPTDIVAHGMTAAQYALAMAHDDAEIVDALWFAGHPEVAAQYRDATRSVREVNDALQVAIEIYDRTSGIDYADVFAERPAEPDWLAAIRAEQDQRRDALREILQRVNPIIEAAKSAGGISFVESQIPS